MTFTTKSPSGLLVRADVEYDELGLTYYRLYAPHVRGTLTVHPEAPAGEADDPDAYTWLQLTFGRYDAAESPSSYADRVSVYTCQLYGNITIVPDAEKDTRDHLRDPWSRIHTGPYGIVRAASWQRMREVGEAVIAQHRADPRTRRQHTAYLRALSDARIARISREADSLRDSVRWLAECESRLRRWTVLRGPRPAAGYDARIGGLLAGWLDERFAGHAAHGDGERSLYLAWTAAARESYENHFYPACRVVVPDVEGIAELIAHLAAAAVQAPGATVRADARAVVRRLAAHHPDLETLAGASGSRPTPRAECPRTGDDTAGPDRLPATTITNGTPTMTPAANEPPIPARIHAVSAGFMAFTTLLLHIVGFAWPISVLAGCGVAALHFGAVLAGRAFVRRR
ncbi:hypothetical protein [Catenulispora rubra]|uniref:hypothetical protein n=1 Tax=Catenulispora rubra TaxID=280293 RepID=UPI0018925532|nr:hypothetical protein [Catenulispora rubra]